MALQEDDRSLNSYVMTHAVIMHIFATFYALRVKYDLAIIKFVRFIKLGCATVERQRLESEARQPAGSR